MRRSLAAALAVIAMTTLTPLTTRAETREEWVTLGARIHGGFGAFIPIGIRIGLDALERLKAKPRELTVIYYDSDKAPCACIADGIMIAATVSPGQRTLQIASEKAPEGALAVVVIRNKQTGEGVRYSIAQSWMPKILEWNKSLDPAGRYDAAMRAEGLFEVTPVK